MKQPCARLSDDRFACFVTDCTDQKELIERIVILGEKLHEPAGTHQLVVSYGVYIVTDRTMPVEEMCTCSCRLIKGAYCSRRGRNERTARFPAKDGTLRLLREIAKHTAPMVFTFGEKPVNFGDMPGEALTFMTEMSQLIKRVFDDSGIGGAVAVAFIENKVNKFFEVNRYFGSYKGNK